MAEEKEDELEEASEEAKPKNKSGAMKIVLIAVGVTLLLGLNAGITVFLVNSSSSQHADAPSEEHGESQDGHGNDAESESAANAEEDNSDKKPIYFKLDPTFVVNFQAQDTLRFLQVTVEIMARDEKVIAAVEQHMPIIRNNLIVLFSSQDFTTISTRVGKERLRAQVLAEVQKVLKEQTGRPGIESVYFTSFVMQ